MGIVCGLWATLGGAAGPILSIRSVLFPEPKRPKSKPQTRTERRVFRERLRLHGLQLGFNVILAGIFGFGLGPLFVSRLKNESDAFYCIGIGLVWHDIARRWKERGA
jgi:hypothetical protein